ncbi:MAG: trans-aconitate 2-methyltransferase [Akkermansiaceae bacterium]
MSDSKENIIEYYENLISKHGHDPRSCDYGRSESQLIKFEAITSATDFSSKSILDIGCGFADFASYLNEHQSGFTYHGVDITPSMVEIASKNHPQHTMECRDILSDPPSQKYDIVTANGIFYLVQENGKEFMQSMVKSMFSLCNEVAVFNSLSTWADFMNDKEFYADPAETLEFCKTITRKIVLKHDYMNHDFSVFLYR